MNFLVRAFVLLILIGSAFVTATASAVLLSFELDADVIRRNAGGQAPVEPLGFWRKPPETKAVMATWRDVPGIAAAARTVVAADLAGDTRPTARVLLLTDLLTSQPSDGAGWLALAENLRAAQLSSRAADAAFVMSLTTSRREPAALLSRGIFAIRFWPDLASARRDAALQGLGDVKPRINQPARMTIAAALGAATPETRAAITASLPLPITTDKNLMKALGF